MGFFTNTGASKEGEIVLSCDRHHLYLITKGKPVEFEKIRVPPGNPNLWVPGQKQGVSIYDMSKGVAYVYNIDSDIWDILDLVHLKKDDADSYTLNILQNFYDTVDRYTLNIIMQNTFATADEFPKNTI